MSDAKHTPTLIDVGVDSELFEKGSSQKYFVISARVGEFDCVLLDTINCHHCLTEEEQQNVAEEFARRYKSHDALVAGNSQLQMLLDFEKGATSRLLEQRDALVAALEFYRTEAWSLQKMDADGGRVASAALKAAKGQA